MSHPLLARGAESIFDGVEMPVAIVLSVADSQTRYITSRIGRMYTEERPIVLATTRLHSHRIRVDGYRIAKFGCKVDECIYGKIVRHTKILDELVVQSSDYVVYYQEACRYWLKACPGLPHFKRNGRAMAPPHGRLLYCESVGAAAFVGCLLNSSLFYWYYSGFADCEHVNDGLVRRLPIPEEWNSIGWERLAGELTKSLEMHATRKVIRTKQGHTIEYDEMKALMSKDVIDKVDMALAEIYGLTEEEATFIINYDTKYRVGSDDEGD